MYTYTTMLCEFIVQINHIFVKYSTQHRSLLQTRFEYRQFECHLNHYENQETQRRRIEVDQLWNYTNCRQQEKHNNSAQRESE